MYAEELKIRLSKDVETRMNTELEKVEFLVGSSTDIESGRFAEPYPVFDDRILDFIDAFNRALKAHPEYRKHPDLAALVFWARRSCLEKKKEIYTRAVLRKGRGWVFQVAPSNIPTLFVYSAFAALLAGNSTAVRISNTEFPQVEIIVETLKDILKEQFSELKDRLVVLRYQHNHQITQFFSNPADGRVLWGSNSSIQSLRQAVADPRCIDICFPEKQSVAVLDSEIYLLEKDKKLLAEKFFRDSMSVDQNACSSPFIVFWRGEDQMEAASIDFWRHLTEVCKARGYALAASQTLDKVNAACSLAIEIDPVIISFNDPPVLVARSTQVTRDQYSFHCGSGFFIETGINTLADLIPCCPSNLQTVLYYGIDKQDFEQLFKTLSFFGGTNITAIGTGLNFDFCWDGIDLIETMSIKVMIS